MKPIKITIQLLFLLFSKSLEFNVNIDQEVFMPPFALVAGNKFYYFFLHSPRVVINSYASCCVTGSPYFFLFFFHLFPWSVQSFIDSLMKISKEKNHGEIKVPPSVLRSDNFENKRESVFPPEPNVNTTAKFK